MFRNVRDALDLRPSLERAPLETIKATYPTELDPLRLSHISG